MKSKGNILASVVCLLGAFQFLASWYFFLFFAQPRKESVFIEAWNTASYTVSNKNPENWFFISMLVSILTSLFCAVAFLKHSNWKLTMSAVALHGVFALSVYELGSAIVFLLPLIYLPSYLKSHETKA